MIEHSQEKSITKRYLGEPGSTKRGVVILGMLISTITGLMYKYSPESWNSLVAIINSLGDKTK